MATTLQITLDDQTAAAAERVAAARGAEVVDLILAYVRSLGEDPQPLDRSKLSPITRRALGLAKGVPNRPYKELLADALADEYLE